MATTRNRVTTGARDLRNRVVSPQSGRTPTPNTNYASYGSEFVDDFARISPSGMVDDILPKPVVSNTKLQNIVNDLYKGTLADALGTVP